MSVLPRALFSLPNNLYRELLVVTGYRFPTFNHSRLSTAIVNIKEDSLLSSTSSLATLSQAAVGNRLQGGTSRYNSPLDAPRAGSSFFRKRLSSSSCRLFASTPSGTKPWLRWWSLCSKREHSSWLRFIRWAITAVCFFVMKALGSWRPVIISRS